MSAPTLAELAGRAPRDPAVSDGRLALDFGELEERSLAAGHGLEALGADPGRHVAICVANRTEFVELALGAWRAGCAFTPLKTGWTAGEVGTVLDDAGTAVVVTDRDGARAAAGARGIPVVDVDAGYERWLAGAGREPFGPDRCGYKMPYTSGTTGRPKGVVMAGSGTVPFEAGFRGLAAWAQALELPGDGAHLFVSRLFNGARRPSGSARWRAARRCASCRGGRRRRRSPSWRRRT